MPSKITFYDHKYSYNGRTYNTVKTTNPSKYFRYWNQKLDIRLNSSPKDFERALFEVKDNILTLKEAIFPYIGYEDDEKLLVELGYSYDLARESRWGRKYFQNMDIRIQYTGTILLVDHYEKQFIFEGRVSDTNKREIAFQSLIELTFEDGHLVNEERFSSETETSQPISKKGAIY